MNDPKQRIEETSPEARPEVIQELGRRAAWCDQHPSQSKTLDQKAQALGINPSDIAAYNAWAEKSAPYAQRVRQWRKGELA